MTRPPRAMILAAGFGTRLGPLTEKRPKPMLPICGVPLVRWAALWLRHHGVREIVINLHHLGEQIEAELGDGRALGVDIVYSHEHGAILGTGGGLRRARPWLDDGTDRPIVVVNGKILLDLDLGAVVAEHERRGAEATLVLRPDPRAETWGSFALDARGRVARFLQGVPRARPQAEPVTELMMFTGVHVLQPRCLDRVPAEGEQCILRTAYREIFHEGEGLFGAVTRGYWWEHSTPERYLRGVANVLAGAVDLPFAPGPLRGVDPTAVVDPTARILDPVWIGPRARIEAGASVGPNTQIGADAVVRRDVQLDACVVWEGVEARESASETVLSGA